MARPHPLDLPVVRPESLRNTGKRTAPLDRDVRPPTAEERAWADAVADRARDSDLIEFFCARALRSFADADDSVSVKILTDLAWDAVVRAERLPIPPKENAELDDAEDIALEVWADRYALPEIADPSRCLTCHRPFADEDAPRSIGARCLRVYADAQDCGVLTPHQLLSNLVLSAVEHAEGLPISFDFSDDIAHWVELADEVWKRRYTEAWYASPDQCSACKRPWPVERSDDGWR